MKGVAIHIGPETCIVIREDGGEALTGGRTGQPLSREKGYSLSGADAVRGGGKPRQLPRQRERQVDPARSQTLRMYGRILHGNREIPPLSGSERGPDRVGKSKDAPR